MNEMTDTDALRLADELAARAQRAAEADCTVLAQFIERCERAGAASAAWSDAVRELRAQQDRRRALMRRRALIQEALGCPVGEQPASRLLEAPPARGAVRARRQVQVRRQRRTRAD